MTEVAKLTKIELPPCTQKRSEKKLLNFCIKFGILNTYSKKTYVLLHFEHKNDVTIFANVLFCIELQAGRTRVAL